MSNFYKFLLSITDLLIYKKIQKNEFLELNKDLEGKSDTFKKKILKIIFQHSVQ
jgi:hypothetical protein